MCRESIFTYIFTSYSCSTCNGGLWKCEKKAYAATCTVYGDPHVKTFDGKRYDMFGKCSYVLVDHCHYGDAAKEFEIISKNTDCKNDELGISCIRNILVNLTSINTRVALGSALKDGRRLPSVIINGEDQKFFLNQDLLVEYVSEENIYVHYRRKDMRIQWTGENIYISVSSEYQNQTCGLCGTYNFNKEDDFHTRSDSTETKVVSFTESWVYSDKDVSQDTSVCHTTGWDTSEAPCNVYRQYAGYAESSCALIKDAEGPFKACHSVVPPNDHYKICKDDACKCQKCYCNIVSAYAKACMDKGVPIDGWRDKTEDCSKLYYFN